MIGFRHSCAAEVVNPVVIEAMVYHLHKVGVRVTCQTGKGLEFSRLARLQVTLGPENLTLNGAVAVTIATKVYFQGHSAFECLLITIDDVRH